MIVLTPSFFIYATVVTVAPVMAALAPKGERVPAFICAAALLASWMVNLSSFTDFSPERLLAGEPTWLAMSRDEHLYAHASAWAVMNTIVALITLKVGGLRIWSSLLFTFLVAGVLNDTLLWSGFTKWEWYSPQADVIFIAEEALFFALGSTGFAGVVSDAVRRLGLSNLSQPPVRRRAPMVR